MADKTTKVNVKVNLLGIAALAAWYIMTSNPSTFDTEKIKSKEAPRIVQEIDHSLDSIYLGDKYVEVAYSGELPATVETLDGQIITSDFDFSKDFDIQTDRYRIVKENDNGFSRTVGWFFSLPARLFFWDYDVSNGLDEERIKQVWATLENDESIDGITVRINNTGVIEDFGRLFKEEQVKDRNPLAARIIMGIPITIGSSIAGEFVKVDNYNPLTQTVMLYSNVEGIAAHEIGHFKDFHRFNTDWAYDLVPIIPFGNLYIESRASLYAKDMLESDQNYQLYRYLMPAFATYVISNINKIKKAAREAEKIAEKYN